MANIAAVLKDEIARISRRESRRLVDPLRKQIASQRHEIAELKRQRAELARALAAVTRQAGRAANTEEPVADSSERKARFSAAGLRSLRQRLGLSAADFGRLIGVSGQSVYNWEQEKARPRRAQIEQLARVRVMGKRQIAKALDEQE